jgi:hypothetical protein
MVVKIVVIWFTTFPPTNTMDSTHDVDFGEGEHRLPVPKEMAVCFDEYQCDRVDFVKSVSELTNDPKNIPCM